ncbi:MAG: hypothetical protein WC119_00925 [Synergistaceae bacterium]
MPKSVILSGQTYWERKSPHGAKVRILADNPELTKEIRKLKKENKALKSKLAEYMEAFGNVETL